MGHAEQWEQLIASTLSNLGELAHDEGDDGRAQPLLEEAISVRRSMGNRNYLGRDIGLLAKVMHRQQEIEQAEGLLREALILRKEEADTVGMVEALEVMASLAVTQQQTERAVRLLTVTEQTRRTISVPRPANETKEFEAARATAGAVLNPTTLSALWNEGSRWTLEQACAYALFATPQPAFSHDSGREPI